MTSTTKSRNRPITAVGVDLGGTRIKIGLVDEQGRLGLIKKYPTRVHLGREALMDRIVGIIGSFLEEPLCRTASPRVIGLGAAGMIDIREGTVLLSPNFPDWHRVPLGPRIREALGLPTYLDNDANAVTFGELWVGAGKDLRNFACLTLGTGVGGGLVLDGRLWYGSHGSGPEIGHLTIKPHGDLCRCGNRGCLETLASAPWLVRRASRLRASTAAPGDSLPGLRGAAPGFTSKDLYRWARRGDADCLRLFRGLGEALGLALANLTHLLSLEGVILGGGLSRAATIFLPYLQKEFNKRCTLIPPEKVHLRVSELQEKSGVLGAAGLALRKSRFRESSG